MNDHNHTPCLNADLSENLQKFLFKCTEREVLVLRLKYGLDDGKVKTLGEVAEILGISRERVRQIEYKALHRHRPLHRAKKIRDFYI
jgi:RNA polymerase primary sigma factor